MSELHTPDRPDSAVDDGHRQHNCRRVIAITRIVRAPEVPGLDS